MLAVLGLLRLSPGLTVRSRPRLFAAVRRRCHAVRHSACLSQPRWPQAARDRVAPGTGRRRRSNSRCCRRHTGPPRTSHRHGWASRGTDRGTQGLPGPCFPGVLVQGDSLHRSEVAALDQGDLAGGRETADLLLDDLDALLARETAVRSADQTLLLHVSEATRRYSRWLQGLLSMPVAAGSRRLRPLPVADRLFWCASVVQSCFRSQSPA
ncbi:DUF6959 family protein [Streptomyces sp. NPDC058142]|uniref:DUF6959 family protein n=1 Tax=Streptomyces sp. NPDC058142 TaxID=3346355 RepID=UPI0036EB5C4B